MAADDHVARPPAGSNANPGTPELPVADIQRGMDLAVAGDTVVVAAGTCTEKTDFRGKNIRVRSVDPSDKAVVSATVISGGSEATHTHAAIRRNAIQYNFANLNGGGIAFADGVIEENLIQTNRGYTGAGLYDCDGPILNNTIFGNEGECAGGGLPHCGAQIRRNRILENTAEENGGGVGWCTGTLRDNLMPQ